MKTPEIGTVLRSRYALTEQLGMNATRQTWLAEDRAQSRTVVVKMLAFNLQLQWQEVKLFEREAQALQRLEHPRIPKYLDYFTIEGKPDWMTLVQSYVPGESLQAKLDRGETFDEERLRQIATDVLTVLSYLHDRTPPVLHRDIKPSNLIAGEGNQTYVVDFGAAQIQSAQVGTFTVVGTYGYTPMEQFGGRAVPASDLYSLGATLVHLATGIPPADLPQKEFRIDYHDRVRLSPTFTQWLDKLIEPRVSDRYASGRSALQRIADEFRDPDLQSHPDDAVTQDSDAIAQNLHSLTGVVPWEKLTLSKTVSSKIWHQESEMNTAIKFRTYTFNEFLQLDIESEEKKPLFWGNEYIAFIGVWASLVFWMFRLKILAVLTLIVFTVNLLIWFSRKCTEHESIVQEIVFSLSVSRFDVFLTDSKGTSSLLSEGMSDILKIVFLGAKQDTRNEISFDSIQVEVTYLDSSRCSLKLDAALHPAELGWIQQNLNRNIQRFHQICS